MPDLAIFSDFLADDDKTTDDRQTDYFTPYDSIVYFYFTSVLALRCNDLPLSQVCMCLIWGTTYCSGGPFKAHTGLGCLVGPFMIMQVVQGDHLCRGTS